MVCLNNTFAEVRNYLSDKFEKIFKYPTIQLAGSLYCNLNCPYCPQFDVLVKDKKKVVSAYPKMIEMSDHLPTIHFYLTGGEPLHSDGICNFLKKMYVHGHIFSFDTNGVISSYDLEKLINLIPNENFGFFNISFHLISGIDIKQILNTTRILQKYNIPHFVKFIAIPQHLSTIEEYKKVFESEGSGTCISMFESYNTDWNGFKYPKDYTYDELVRLLDMVSLVSHAVQFFGGFLSKGISCSAGSNFITYNLKGNYEFGYCCHSDKELIVENLNHQLANTRYNKCDSTICHGDIMSIFSLHNIIDEKTRFQRLCLGDSKAIGIHNVLNEIELITKKVRLVYNEKFEFLLRNIV